MSVEYEAVPMEVNKEEKMNDCVKYVECPLSKDQLLELVKEEERRRVSKEFLEAAEREESGGETDGTEEIVKMQEDVVKSFGYPPEFVDVLRNARYWYPGVNEFWEVPLQVRNNIMRECRFNVGDSVPNLELLNLKKVRTKLYTKDKEVLTVILAGSFS